MVTTHFKKIAILGLGLIGSSLARAIAEKKLAGHIAVFDISAAAMHFAFKEGFVHSHHAHAGEAVKDAELIIFAGPPSSFASLARDISPFIKPGAIVTDVGSVKRQAIAFIVPALPKGTLFVPGHPIAGSEKIGVQAGRADLFTGKRVILTPEEQDVLSAPVETVRKFWADIGAKVEYMPADLHDRMYAYVSHLPQLIAYAARSEVGDSATGIVRLAQSSIPLWVDICNANADYVIDALDDFTDFTAQIAGELTENKEPSVDDAATVAALFPKVIATCLVATATLLQELTGVHPAHFAGSGFASMTAPATEDPEAALASISTCHKLIAQKLSATLAKVHDMKKALGEKDRGTLTQLLESGRH